MKMMEVNQVSTFVGFWAWDLFYIGGFEGFGDFADRKQNGFFDESEFSGATFRTWLLPPTLLRNIDDESDEDDEMMKVDEGSTSVGF